MGRSLAGHGAGVEQCHGDLDADQHERRGVEGDGADERQRAQARAAQDELERNWASVQDWAGDMLVERGVDRISAELGHPTIVMWNGTLEDNRLLTAAELMAAAREWFAAQAVIVGHANQPTITTVYDELIELIAELELQTVTLADVWGTGLGGVRTATGSATLA